MQLIVPTVHLNGTGKVALVQQRKMALETGRAFVEALQSGSPHSRDFYPQGEGAFAKVREIHLDRLKLVDFILTALTKEAVEILKK